MDIKEIIENFDLFEEWEDKYSYLIELGRKLPVTSDDFKVEKNEVKGCVSKVWLSMEKTSDGCLIIKADSDAQIVRGLVFLVLTAFNKKTLVECKRIDIKEVFIKTGLDEHLTPNRRNGFYSIVDKLNKFIQINT